MIETFTRVDRKIVQAKEGDSEAATWLVQEFCGAFRRSPGDPSRYSEGAAPTYLEDRLLDYLVECFDTLFDEKGRKIKGSIAGHALNLTSSDKRGPKTKSSVTSRNFGLGLMVMQQYNLEKARPDQSGLAGSNLERAIAKIAEEEGEGDNMVREAYKEYKSRMSFLKDAVT